MTCCGATKCASVPSVTNSDALAQFVASDYRAVIAAVGAITGNRQDAADAVQDALVGLLARPPREEIRNLAAWVTVTATQRARDRHRARLAESRALARIGVAPHAVQDRSEALDPSVRRALAALPEQQRRACALYYLADQSVETVAETLGVTAGTVKKQLHRARRSLAIVFEAQLVA